MIYSSRSDHICGVSKHSHLGIALLQASSFKLRGEKKPTRNPYDMCIRTWRVNLKVYNDFKEILGERRLTSSPAVE